MNRPHLKGGADWSDADYMAYLKSKSVVTEAGCWEWQGFKYQSRNSRSWYGTVSCRGKKGRVHRVAYHLVHGPIPEGVLIMHLCDNSICCNPDHLKAGTTQENLKDAAAKGSYRFHASHYTRCKWGHEFTPENTNIDSRGFRQCKTCGRIRMATPEYKAASRERQRRNRAKARQSAQSESPNP